MTVMTAFSDLTLIQRIARSYVTATTATKPAKPGETMYYKNGQVMLTDVQLVGRPEAASATAPPMPTNFAHGVADAREFSREIIARLGRLADRLCGSDPTAIDEKAMSSSGAGVLGAVESDAETICGLMKEAMIYLSRIEDRLPPSEL